MDLTLLRAFIAVAREGNLTRAAAQLHLTQPAVSLQIKNLQQALGVTLFTRGSHGLSLTGHGHALIPYAERAVAAAQDVKRAAEALCNDVSGKLRIGTILDPEFLRLGLFLKRLVETWPQIRTTVRHGMSGWVLDNVRADKLDVGYYIEDCADDKSSQSNDAVCALSLTEFQYRVLGPGSWKERLSEMRDWNALAALPWIWTPPDSAHQRLLSRCFDEAGCQPQTVAEVDQESSMLELVKSGVGLTLVRDSTALAAAHAHALTIVDGIALPARLCFVARRDRVEDPVIAAAFDLIKQQWAV
ncbi:LysR family transcriptional regulator [Paraburkholderia caribensis]|uniref:LysR family transcriptional regulator n=1 Tax=Paraburkholderia caribensis TaxID=75105 RepID=UPI001CAEAD0C|nr:LysR family transcriptional regulator [Paraburkholderia caribensis]CAG9243811.1 Transcriptional regulator [Paraburkholderia caribensis]